MAKKNYKKPANKPANAAPVDAKAAEEARLQKAQAQQAKEQARKYSAAMMKVKPFSRIAAVLSVVVLLLFFVQWGYVYNTSIPGTEVSFNGFSAAIARVTGNFTTMSTLYGDLAVPFYYYAQTYVESLSMYTLLALLAVLVTLVLAVVATLKKLYTLNIAAACAGLISSVLLFVCHFTALAMKNGDILAIYCQGNPACSIRSAAIWPAIIMLLVVAANAFVFLQVTKARKLAK